MIIWMGECIAKREGVDDNSSNTVLISEVRISFCGSNKSMRQQILIREVEQKHVSY